MNNENEPFSSITVSKTVHAFRGKSSMQELISPRAVLLIRDDSKVYVLQCVLLHKWYLGRTALPETAMR